MATLEAFRPLIQTELPTCPQLLVDRAVRDACRVFALDTWLLSHEYQFDTAAGVPNYSIDAPTDHEAFALVSIVTSTNRTLAPALDNFKARVVPQTGTPSRFMVANKELWLTPTPPAPETLFVSAVVRPTLTANTVDDRCMDYSDAIKHLVMGRLKSMTGQLWSDPVAAKDHFVLYNSFATQYQTDRDRSGIINVRRVVPRFF